MVKRKRLTPDNRLDWRNPDMKCVRVGTVNGVFGTHEIAPQHIKNYYLNKMENENIFLPDWYNDPTYNLKNKNKKV